MQPKTPPLNLVAIRQRYQKALLTWLRDTASDHGLRQMRAVLGAVALIQLPEHVGFWRDAEALVLAAIDQKNHPEDAPRLDPQWLDDGGFRKLVSKLDYPFKQLVRGHPAPDPLLWDELRAALNPPPASDPASHALARMLAKTTSILPLVAQAASPRFPEEASQCWNEASQRVRESWDTRYQSGWPAFRSAVFGLCGAALALSDAAFLRFTEALASVMDRVDDEQEPPVHIVAAIASAVDCLADRNFLEHNALYSRLDLFATRLEKVVEEEARIARVVRGVPVPEPGPVPEIRVPQEGWGNPENPSGEPPGAPSVFEYLQGLKTQSEEPDQPALQAIAVGDAGLAVEEIPEIAWEDNKTCPEAELLLEDGLGGEVQALDENGEGSAAPEKPASKTLLEDGQLLCRVARDLEALADSLHLSGLSRQAGELAVLVERILAAELDAALVRADLLQVIQCMQDQVGAVVMGFPPHANPRISELMGKLAACLPE